MSDPTLHARFWSKVDASGDCWQWLASCNRFGYGQFRVRVDGRWVMRSAHRTAWSLLVGVVPEGLQLDHLCRNRRCVNPDHLEAVTPRVNLRRGYGRSGMEARQTHCRYGHPFDGVNSYLDPRGRRVCRACVRRKVYEQRARGIRYDRSRSNAHA